MPIRVWVVANGQGILVLEVDEAGHGIWAGAVHPDLPVMVQRHEAEPGVDPGIYDGDVQVIGFLDLLPIMH